MPGHYDDSEDLDKRLKTLSDAVDKRAAEQQQATDSAPVEAGEAAPAKAPAGDVQPLVDTLGVTPEIAGMMMEVAQDIESLKSMSAEQLAKHLNQNIGDMQMVMMEVARKQDAAAEMSDKPMEGMQGVSGTAAI